MVSKDPKSMLGKLFGSNSRVKILKLFLLHPESKFYIRQIARDLKVQLNSVRRELENLEKFGLLTSRFEVAGDCRISGSDMPRELSAGYAVTTNSKKGEEFFTAIATSAKDLTSKPEGKSAFVPHSGASAGKQEKKFYKVNKDFILYEEIKLLIIKAQILYEKDFAVKIQKAGQPKLLILTGIFANNQNSIIDILAVGKFDKQKFFKIIKELENELGREINFTIMDIKEFKYRRDITDVFLYSVLEGKKFVVIDELSAC